jgi:hypothetical protein
MLIRVIILMIVLFVPAAALGQPQITFDDETYDFGIVSGSLLLEHSFEVRNEGTEDLIIRKLDAP